MATQLYHKYTLPASLLDARLDGEFANLYTAITAFPTSPVTIANGGTNSTTALNNNRVIQSAAGKIVEAAAITASRALASDANGIPVAATTTSAELNFVNGVTSAIQTQLNAKQATGNYVTALTGDVTASGPGSVAATLATVNASPGATTISSVTTNGKGLVTANTSATTTGSGNVVLATSPSLVTPILGTPTSGTLTNCTGLPVAGISAVAWTAYTPTITAQIGTITTSSASGRYQQIGKNVFFSIKVTITTAGSALGDLNLTLPVTTQDNLTFQYAGGYEGAVVGVSLRGIIASNQIGVRDYKNAGVIVNGAICYISGTYEAA